MIRLSPLAVVVVLCACGEAAAPLDGSLTAVCDVSYTRATLEATDGYLSLRFLQARGAAEDVVLKVGVSIDGAVPSHSVQYDLAEAISGGQRGTATRNVLDDPDHTLFPPLSRGLFRADGDLAHDTIVKGEISLTFAVGNQLGSGRAVFGPFEAEVVR
ncbi:MAG: hypothetical protein IPJ65_17925 [Archangiaceae bacterium]|nr:hypothetical protein [Archangiaceae bacterium]